MITKLLLPAVALFLAFSVNAAPFRAGIAVRIVTPDPLLPVSGGVGPSQPVTEKRGDLTVRALVFEKSGVKVGIISVDFLGFPAVLGDKVRARVPSIPPENILIGATHTHSAPDCYGFPDGKGGFAIDLKYVESVCLKAAEALLEAEKNLRPARVKIATGAAEGKIAYNYYAEKLYDPRCHVIQVLEPNGDQVVATLVNYAIHPEVLGSKTGLLSPDLIGPLYERLQQRGGGVGLFMNSAQGGMVTADNRGPDGKDLRTWEECQRIGHLLAEEALRLVASAPLHNDPELFCTNRIASFPIDSDLLRAVMKASPLGYGEDTRRIRTRLNLVNIGDAQIVTIPGEALPNIGFYLKRNMKGRHNLLFGLTNDAFGYILTKEDWGSFKRYDYVSRTSLGERTGTILVDELLQLVESSPAPAR